VCPELLHDVAQYEITHQVLERAPAATPAPLAGHGLVVGDHQRGMAGRRTALTRRRHRA
jgi:hypothetical protein